MLQELVQPMQLVPYEQSDEDFSADSDITYLPSDNKSDISDFSDYEIAQDNAKTLTRCRKSKPNSWKENVTKFQRSQCLPYKNKKKQCVAKVPKTVDCTNCTFKCNSNFSECERNEICKTYWGLANYQRQKDYILKCVKMSEPKRRKVPADSDKARSLSKSYYLENKNGKHRVCAKFFEKTLCISNGPIITAIKGCNAFGVYDRTDKRGCKPPGNKTSEYGIAMVKRHIESFPVMESHYSRKSTKKLYLDSTLSISKMFDLYKNDFCTNNNIVNPVSEKTYRRIFCNNYNLSFFKPKKDLCALCYKYENATSDQKKDLEVEYCLHLIRKGQCNEAKAQDKLRCQEDPSFVTCTFDLQSVLQIPCSSVSLFYYSRKICVYNLTIYVGDGKEAHCYTWNELHGKRGSSEIGSILYNFLKNLPSTVSEISLFCDTCGGQNRNQQVAAMLLYVVQNIEQLMKIELKFLESGHTYMECDSMHSAIEAAKKHKSAYCMNDWVEIFKSARNKRGKNKSNDKYKVHVLTYKDFYNLQELAASTIKNRNKDIHGNKVTWLKIKCIKVEKEFPGTLFYKYDHTSDYNEINVSAGRGRRRTQTVELNPAYKNLLPLSAAKKGDILKLCNSGLIPEELIPWYKSLPSSSGASDSVPEPSFDDSDESDEN